MFPKPPPSWSERLRSPRAAGEAPGPGAEFSAMGDRDFARLASMLGSYAENLIEQGQFARAAPMALEGLRLFQARGDHHGIADCLGALGRLAQLQGSVEAHVYLHAKWQASPRTCSYRVIQCRWQPLLGLVTLYGGDALDARRLLDESLRLGTDLKNKLFLTHICAYLAETALWDRELEQAGKWLAQSLAYYPDTGLDHHVPSGASLGRRAAPGRCPAAGTGAPPCSSGWPNRCAVTSDMSWLSRYALKSTPRWRRCGQRWTLRLLSRPSMQESGYHLRRHMPLF